MYKSVNIWQLYQFPKVSYYPIGSTGGILSAIVTYVVLAAVTARTCDS